MYPVPNKHGSYPDEKAERIEYKTRKEFAIVMLLQVGDNAWLYASNYTGNWDVFQVLYRMALGY